MRLVQATVPPGVTPRVKQVLDEHDVDYFVTPETGTDEYSDVVFISIPEEVVESVLEKLYAAGLDSDDHVVIIETEVDIFGRADSAADGVGKYARIAAAELHGKTEDLLPDVWSFVTMMVLSTIVATTGVLLDSPAVVVGSMVLAPLYGPAVSASVGTVIDESDLFWDGVRLQVLGVVLAVATATLFSVVMRYAYLLPSGFSVTAAPQVVDRLSPDLLSLVVALVAGVAGVVSIATASARALVGVMMAAALLPPAAIVGIGIAWFDPTITFHSGVLLAVNLLAINFAGLVALWYLGYRPKSWIRIPQTRRALLKRGGTLLVAILVTSAFLWNVTYANAQRAQLNDAIQGNVRDVLDSDAYDDVSLLDVRVVRDRASLFYETEKVTVTIGRPPGEARPTLHRRIVDAVEGQVDHDVAVDIHVSLLVPTRRLGTDPSRLPTAGTTDRRPSPVRGSSPAAG